jgi:UDP-N-acetylglucosamine 2-epimerase (non-hydrolysing)
VDELRPSAVVVAGAGDAILAVALVCHKKGVRLVHSDAGRRIGRQARDLNSVLIEQMSEIFYAADKAAFDTLSAFGAPKSRMLQAGNLLGDAVRLCRESQRSPADILAHVHEVQPWLSDLRGFGVVGMSCAIDATPRDELAEYLSVARQVSQDIPLVWPIAEDARARLDAIGLRNLVDDSRIVLIPPLSYPDMVSLIAGASLVVTDSHHVEAEASALGVPCLRLDQDQENVSSGRQSGGRKAAVRNVLTLPDIKKIGAGPARSSAPPKELDGHAAERMADHLTQWLLSTALVAQLVRT